MEGFRTASTTHISSDLTVTGTILTDGAVEISGTVNGDICARSVIINPGAEFRGEIVAENVSLAGRGTGRITARSVAIKGTAHFKGDILHQSLSIEASAQFEGSVLRKTDEAAWEKISETFVIEGVELTPEAQAAVQALKSEFAQRNQAA
ncbi:MAG: polymer-forming cytoskeletal protein [Neomegalonema sp.]|nr:polymer-forming cytoskeletal protein [Neomegalonema sp.]